MKIVLYFLLLSIFKNTKSLHLRLQNQPSIQQSVTLLEISPKLKVLQITDTHIDPHYAKGSNADCDSVLCCHNTSGIPTSNLAKAGKWGHIYRNCDT